MADIDLNAAELEATFRRSLDAFNDGDWTAFREGVTDGCLYEEIGSDERFEGADAYLDRVRMWRSALPDVNGTVESLTVSGNRLAAEIHWRGTHTGTLETPAGAIPATGKATDTRAVMVVESDGTGRATRIRHYTNPMLLMQQLGLMPAADQMLAK